MNPGWLSWAPRLLGSMREMIEAELGASWGEGRAAVEMDQAGREHFAWRWWRYRRIHSRFGWKFWAIISGGLFGASMGLQRYVTAVVLLAEVRGRGEIDR